MQLFFKNPRLSEGFFLSKGEELKIKNLSELELLALLSAASVLRKEKYFDTILNKLISVNYPLSKVYEAILQTYLFAGFPSALVSLKKLQETTGNRLKYEEYDLKKFLKRGKANCKKIYGSKYNKLISNVKSFSPDLAAWLIIEGYGKVLGRKVLSLKEREICIISILSALKFKDQLYSHINGAVRLKLNLSFIEKTIKNLSIITASASKFGLQVFEQYRLLKNLKSTEIVL